MALLRRLYFIFAPFYKKFGKNTCVYKPMQISGKKYISIGERCNICEGARIEAIDRWGDKHYEPEIIIGDNTSFENFIHLVSAGKISIGHDCVFSSRVFIAQCEHEYITLNEKVMNQRLTTADITIGDYCFLGMDVKVFPGVNIGNNVIVGANSIVMNDLPEYTVCVGVPAKPIKKYDVYTAKWESC